MSQPADDRYSRLDYRRLIAWPKRLERERPLLEELLATAPHRRLADCGCGTGEHARWLVERGFAVVGVDASESMLAKARQRPLPDGLTLVHGDLAELGGLLGEGAGGSLGGAICLGNTLPHLRRRADLAGFFGGLRRHLADGGFFLLQLLNYDRIVETGQRHLPVNFRAGDRPGEEIVFLRLMTPRPDGSVLFNPTSLRYRPSADPPVEVVAAKNVELTGWRRTEVEELLEAAGFTDRTVYGGIEKQPYAALESSDLVMVAR